ncbi:tRNA G18 (ribose-2'-O)-methylase SpoU [Nonomuraea muscovyensis]|uniref:tRNA G18 (Ribose-2'-O)-methylase SpoU n=1 Tax=Nonomuraea muscovyensis TaxID=1124761 RepID=A0A7X0C9Y1_9ACTN|nr:RNA methyltransferase [Nonomuraea muscovyensis]MBB6351265.1 tRNA G18 (ribose-2'-O)-methylase SpoU [Nonomuraea muscovyensis]
MLEYVTDPADPRLADYTRLRDMELRKSLEAERGLFLAEGEKVIRRAFGAGFPVRSVLTTRRWLDPLADVLNDALVYVVDDEVMAGIAGFPVHRGALASMARLPLPPVEAVLAPPPDPRRVDLDDLADDADAAPAEPRPRRLLVLEDLVDHGNVEVAEQHPRRILVLEDLVDHSNVGAIFRCAAALGVDGIILSPRCADPLYRRAVKVSMGAVFSIPYARMENWFTGLDQIREAGFQTLALTPDPSVTSLDEVKMTDRVALLLGSEGDGLSSRWLEEADEAVCIPMSPAAMAAGVDSLNVVAAAAIACHGLMRSGAQ